MSQFMQAEFTYQGEPDPVVLNGPHRMARVTLQTDGVTVNATKVDDSGRPSSAIALTPDAWAQLARDAAALVAHANFAWARLRETTG